MNNTLLYFSNDDDFNLNILLSKNKEELKQNLIRTLNENESNMKIFHVSIDYCKQQISKYKHLEETDRTNKNITYKLSAFRNQYYIWNFAAFINLISMDLKTLQIGLYFAETEWQKRFYARFLYTLVYESIHDILDFFGKDFKNLLKTKYYSKLDNITLKDLRKRINNFKVEYIGLAHKIRNNTFAHKDHEVLSQIDIITNINWFKTIETAITFESILNDIGNYLQKLIKEGSLHLQDVYQE